MCRCHFFYFVLFHALSSGQRVPAARENEEFNLIDAAENPLNISTSGCATDDFGENQTCTLSCFISTAETNFKLTYYTFIYYSVDPLTNVTLFHVKFSEGTSFNNHTYALHLPLHNFFSGFYQCHFTLEDPYAGSKLSPSATFHIATSQGVNLHSFCDESSDCLALNSQCVNSSEENSICKCDGLFNISYNEREDSPACLQPVLFHEHCNKHAQCPNKRYPIKCINHLCRFNVTKRQLLLAEDIATQIINKLNGIHITIIVVSVAFILVIAISVIIIYLIRHDKFLPFVQIIKKQEATYRVDIRLKEDNVETVYYQSEETETNNIYESLQPQRKSSTDI